jgi:hypothetical protein
MDVSVTHGVIDLSVRQYADRHFRIRPNRGADWLELQTPLVHFRPVDGHVARSDNAEPNAVAFHGNHGHSNVVIYDDLFADSTRQD